MEKKERSFWIACIATAIVGLTGLVFFRFISEVDVLGALLFFVPVLLSLACTIGTTPKKIWEHKDWGSGFIIGGYLVLIISVIIFPYMKFIAHN